MASCWGCVKKGVPSKVFRYLYLAYVISCIGDRLWTFAIALILQYLGGLRLVSINQLAEGVTQMALSTYVGNWLDRHNRKTGVLTVLAFNNVNVALSAGLLSVCLSVEPSSAVYSVCLVLSIVACAVSTLASEGERIAFTKDWVVEMAKREPNTALSRRNAMLKTIDQLSSVVAPIVAGVVLLKTSHRMACLLFVVWNLLSWIVEGFLLVVVYRSLPELAVRETGKNKKEAEAHLAAIQEADDENTNCEETISVLSKWSELIRTYWRQSVFPAAIGLAMLYMTVLGFDGLAVSYGKSQGLTEDILGGFRSVGSAMGVAGAIIYTVVERKIGVRKSGFIGLLAQQTALYLCVLSIWLPGSPFDPAGYSREFDVQNWWSQFKSAFTISKPGSSSLSNITVDAQMDAPVGVDWSTGTVDGHSIISVFALLSGITLARLGLWMADLSITQIMQELVAERERNTVFGVQNAVCQFFSVLKDMTVIILPDPRTFGLLVLTSVAFVTSGFFSYTFYLIKSRDANRVRASTTKLSRTNGKDTNAEHKALINGEP